MAANERSGTVPTTQYNHVVKKYNELHHRYLNLEKRHKERGLELARVTEIYRKASEIANQWKEWYEQHQDEFQAIQQSKRKVAERDPDPRNSYVEQRPKHNPEHVSSSQTTEDAPASPPPLETAAAEDEVEAVCARPVKRRRVQPGPAMPRTVRIKQEANSPDQPMELTSDDFSSPPREQKPQLRTQESDLDALDPSFKTPRKRRRTRAVSEEVNRPALFLRTVSSLSEGDINEVNVPTTEPAPPRKALPRLPQRKQSATRAALQPLSINLPGSPHRSAVRGSASRRRTPTQKDIDILCEDGDMQSSQVADPQPAEEIKRQTNDRLNLLLDQPTPDKAPLSRRRTPETVIRRRQERPAAGPQKANPTISPPVLAKDAQRFETSPERGPQRSPRRPQARARHPARLEKSPPPPTQEDEPLRSRPLDTLQVSDFRVNPKYLGSDFAFADTIRGRDQRRCLVTCTRPECCGNAFRKAIEVGAIQDDKSNSQVLEEYLGPDWKNVLTTFGAEKQKDLLMQARAYSFANEHGKHRTAFERAESPPGFWRTDMPTTQEAEEDRSRAREFERRKVEERWREALRPGGRWIFRDEVGG